MKTIKRLEIEELSGAWILTIDEKSQAYSQRPELKDYKRMVKDIINHLELKNLLRLEDI